MTHPRPQRTRAQEEAAEWLARLGDYPISTQTVREFRDWRDDPANDAAYEEAEAFWEANGQVAADPELTRMPGAALRAGDTLGATGCACRVGDPRRRHAPGSGARGNLTWMFRPLHAGSCGSCAWRTGRCTFFWTARWGAVPQRAPADLTRARPTSMSPMMPLGRSSSARTAQACVLWAPSSTSGVRRGHSGHPRRGRVRVEQRTPTRLDPHTGQGSCCPPTGWPGRSRRTPPSITGPRALTFHETPLAEAVAGNRYGRTVALGVRRCGLSSPATSALATAFVKGVTMIFDLGRCPAGRRHHPARAAGARRMTIFSRGQ